MVLTINKNIKLNSNKEITMDLTINKQGVFVSRSARDKGLFNGINMTRINEVKTLENIKNEQS